MTEKKKNTSERKSGAASLPIPPKPKKSGSFGVPRWLYKGLVTTPISIPGQDSIVLKPRYEFDAPEGAVRHLIAQRLVVRVRPKKRVKKSRIHVGTSQKPLTEIREHRERIGSGGVSEPDDVVASELEKVSEATGDAGTDAREQEQEQEQEMPKVRKGKSRKK